MKKNWCHKIDISVTELDRELNAFSEQGYEIYKLWNSSYDNYEIIAYKDPIIPKVLREAIRGALARGYGSKRNEKKTLDPDLIEDMAIEVEKSLANLCEHDWQPEWVKPYATSDGRQKMRCRNCLAITWIYD